MPAGVFELEKFKNLERLCVTRVLVVWERIHSSSMRKKSLSIYDVILRQNRESSQIEVKSTLLIFRPHLEPFVCGSGVQ